MIRVLVVDDSYLMRKLISDMLNSDPEIEVIAKAKDGKDAIDKIKEYKPDVITLDLEMPGMSGLDVLKVVMQSTPLPVIIVSAYTKPGARETIKAFRYGAVDFITKPSGPISADIGVIKEKLIRYVKTATKLKIKPLKFVIPKTKIINYPSYSRKVLVLGASSGGPPALESLLSSFPADLPIPVLVVQHMPVGFTKSFAERLDEVCGLKVKEAKDGEIIKPGLVLLAPGNKHLGLKKKGMEIVVQLEDGPPVNNIIPSIDITMKDVAEYCKDNAIGVILTGIGQDGAKGMESIKNNGGKTIVQDRETSLIYGMPKVVNDRGLADYVLPLQKISKKIVELL